MDRSTSSGLSPASASSAWPAPSAPWVNIEAAWPRRDGHDPVDPLQQLVGSHGKRRGQLDEVVDAWQAAPHLHEADVGPVQGGELAELFLREARSAARPRQVLAES